MGGDCGTDRKSCVSGVALTLNQRAADRSGEHPCGSPKLKREALHGESRRPKGRESPLPSPPPPGSLCPRGTVINPVKVCRGALFGTRGTPVYRGRSKIVTGTGFVSFHCKSASLPGGHLSLCCRSLEYSVHGLCQCRMNFVVLSAFYIKQPSAITYPTRITQCVRVASAPPTSFAREMCSPRSGRTSVV